MTNRAESSSLLDRMKSEIKMKSSEKTGSNKEFTNT